MGCRNVEDALYDLDYMLFKFRRPVEHVSVDIDVLIRDEHVVRAVKRLGRLVLGWRLQSLIL